MSIKVTSHTTAQNWNLSCLDRESNL